MLGTLKHIPDVALFDNFALIHHSDVIGNAGHHIQVMADKNQRHLQIGAQLPQQFQNFRLHRHIQRGGRFIGNQQHRIAGESHGNHNPLDLSPR